MEQNATDTVFQWQEVVPHTDDRIFTRLGLQVVSTSEVVKGGKPIELQLRLCFLEVLMNLSHYWIACLNYRDLDIVINSHGKNECKYTGVYGINYLKNYGLTPFFIAFHNFLGQKAYLTFD